MLQRMSVIVQFLVKEWGSVPGYYPCITCCRCHPIDTQCNLLGVSLGQCEHYIRVATAQGKQGIWFLLFPDRENTGNFVITQGKFLRHRENIFDCIH